MKKQPEKQFIEQLINQSIKRLKDEYELLNSTMLNALHQNIDILINHSEKWFPDGIPLEFKGVLNSLMTVSYLYFQEKGDVGTFEADTRYEEFRPDSFINNVISDMESILRLKNISVDLQVSDSTIRTSRKTLRDALYNIFLSISQFMKDGSSTKIELRDESSRMRLSLGFNNLSDHLPDISKLSKVFYSYFDGSEYHINVGINVALENLRNIGVIVKVSSVRGTNSLLFSLTIPTTHFLDTIEEIRKDNVVAREGAQGEEIGLCFEDIILEMVIMETLSENGYSSSRVAMGDIREGKIRCRKLVADCESLAKSRVSAEELPALTGHIDRLVIIYGDNDCNLPADSEKIVLIRKPFDVDAVISHLR
jgi:hypothetical protein